MELTIDGKKFIKALIEKDILIPKNDKNTLFIPVDIKFEVNGNVLRVLPSTTVVTFDFDREMYEENRPKYNKNLINVNSDDKFDRSKIEEKLKDMKDCSGIKIESQEVKKEVKTINKKKSIF